jgi:hypothetical protein
VTIEARASDPDGTIVRLEIRDGTNTIGIITNSQSLSITRDHLGPGRHELSAVAIDNGGGRGESLPVTVIVLPPNLPPIIRWMTPANGAVFDASEVITLQATAADLDGLVERVEFRDGTCVIGVLTTAPFSLTWTNASLGKHSLTIVAVDDRGSFASPVPTATSPWSRRRWIGTTGRLSAHLRLQMVQSSSSTKRMSLLRRGFIEFDWNDPRSEAPRRRQPRPSWWAAGAVLAFEISAQLEPKFCENDHAAGLDPGQGQAVKPDCGACSSNADCLPPTPRQAGVHVLISRNLKTRG